MTETARSGQSGFSLIELTVAMVVTLIVTGAIYGLLAGGQSAFRREPELSDRQQNIRVAMDVIMKDISNAGAGLPQWVQVFTRGLDASTGGPFGLNSERTDELEMITNTLGRDNEPVCFNSGTFVSNAGSIRTVRNVTAMTPAFSSQTVVILFLDGTWTMRYVTGVSNAAVVSGEANCTSGNPALLAFSTTGDGSGMNNSSGTTCQPNNGVSATGTPAMGDANSGTLGCNGLGSAPCCTASEIALVQLVHYRIRYSGTVPELQRWDSSSPGTVAAPAWRTIARGIEDMQVQYTQADGTVSATGGAPAVVRNTYGSLITQVTVTLTSRSEARNIQGATTDVNLGTFVRGSLTWTGSPRSALFALTKQGGVAALWR